MKRAQDSGWKPYLPWSPKIRKKNQKQSRSKNKTGPKSVKFWSKMKKCHPSTQGFLVFLRWRPERQKSKKIDFSKMSWNVTKWPKMMSNGVPDVKFAVKRHQRVLEAFVGAPHQILRHGSHGSCPSSGVPGRQKSKKIDFSNMSWNVTKWPKMMSNGIPDVEIALKRHQRVQSHGVNHMLKMCVFPEGAAYFAHGPDILVFPYKTVHCLLESRSLPVTWNGTPKKSVIIFFKWIQGVPKVIIKWRSP